MAPDRFETYRPVRDESEGELRHRLHAGNFFATTAKPDADLEAFAGYVHGLVRGLVKHSGGAVSLAAAIATLHKASVLGSVQWASCWIKTPPLAVEFLKSVCLCRSGKAVVPGAYFGPAPGPCWGHGQRISVPGSFEVPDPVLVSPYLPFAAVIASRMTKPTIAHKDRVFLSIWIEYARLSGTPIKQPSSQAGSGERAGVFIDIMKIVNDVYRSYLRDNVGSLASGATMERIAHMHTAGYRIPGPKALRALTAKKRRKPNTTLKLKGKRPA